MTIKKTPMTAKEVAKLFDLGHWKLSDLSALDKAGFQAVMNLSGTQLDFYLGGDKVVTNLPLKAGALKLMQEGMMPSAGKDLLQNKISSSMIICLKMMKEQGHVATWSTPGDVTDEQAGKIGEGLLKDIGSSPYGDEPDDIAAEEAMEAEAFEAGTGDSAEPDEWEQGVIAATDAVKALKMPKVKLIDAKAQYQPVGSSSQGSTYHAIAKSGLLRFAARLSGETLSIRVEGPVKSHKKKLVAAGFNESYFDKGYTSVHFSGVDLLMARRTLGAVLMGTGLDFDWKMPDLEIIAGKGA